MKVKELIIKSGGQTLVGKICGVSRQAVSNWVACNSLPNSEWTGKTNYAVKISQQAKMLGHEIHPLELCPGAGQYMKSTQNNVVQSEPQSEVSYASHRV